MGLGQPFPYRRGPGTPTPSLGYTKTLEPQRKETLICGATSARPVLSLEGQHLSPPLLFFSSPSFLPIWGGRRKTRCKSPVPRGWAHQFFPGVQPGTSHLPQLTAKGTGMSDCISQLLGFPTEHNSTPIFRCLCTGRGSFPFSLSSPICTDLSPSHTGLP